MPRIVWQLAGPARRSAETSVRCAAGIRPLPGPHPLGAELEHVEARVLARKLQALREAESPLPRKAGHWA
jgi:hypothetical protein